MADKIIRTNHLGDDDAVEDIQAEVAKALGIDVQEVRAENTQIGGEVTVPEAHVHDARTVLANMGLDPSPRIGTLGF